MLNGSSFCETQFNVVGFLSVWCYVCTPFLNELTGRDHDWGPILRSDVKRYNFGATQFVLVDFGGGGEVTVWAGEGGGGPRRR